MSLKRLLEKLAESSPPDRIELRDQILEFGPACIEPLESMVAEHPRLLASIASWLEALARRDPETRTSVRIALKRLAGRANGDIARQALDRLDGAANGTSVNRTSPRTKPKPSRDAGAEVHSRIIVAAKAGRILTYSDLETSRGHVGGYLRRIVQEEHDAGHPPLTAIVVSKTTGKPGDGFLPAMIEIGYAQPGETLTVVWHRAVDAVHLFWRGRP